MFFRIKHLFFSLLLLISLAGLSQTNNHYNAIYSGIPWFDNNGNVVSAHGACIVKDNDRYYLFGEKHTDTSNAFAGFNCYSSIDLYNWKFESIALSVQSSGKMGPNRVGERVKVMKCPATGEYVMYMHADTLSYTDQFTGYATAKNITGPYTFKGPLLFNGNPIKKWDMGVFQDLDGSGYLLLHGGDICKLSDDYKSIATQVCKSFDREMEAPVVFRKDSIYYFLGSHLSSWEKNDNDYYTATSLKGPWKKQGTFAPQGTLTWYSQSTFVLPVQGSKQTSYLFMGDRWSFPKQYSAATYIWQPLSVSGYSLSIPTFLESWKMDLITGIYSSVTLGKKTIIRSNDKRIMYSGNWQQDTLLMKSSTEKGASVTVKFKGTGIRFYGLSCTNGGYANVLIRNSKGETMLSSIIDLYCKYPLINLKFMSPVFAKDNYTLTITNMGERGNWSDKRKSNYGSTGYRVAIDKLIVSD